MSNICKRLSKVKKKPEKKVKLIPREPITKHVHFNIFTKDGKNRSVDAPYPMTLEEAGDYFDALCIGADD